MTYGFHTRINTKRHLTRSIARFRRDVKRSIDSRRFPRPGLAVARFSDLFLRRPGLLACVSGPLVASYLCESAGAGRFGSWPAVWRPGGRRLAARIRPRTSAIT